MTRAQGIAMLLIGAVAISAFWQTRRLAQSLQANGIIRQPQTFNV